MLQRMRHTWFDAYGFAQDPLRIECTDLEVAFLVAIYAYGQLSPFGS